jgi:hypothetical protein
MIRDLDATIGQLLTKGAPAGSALAGATISFDLPDAAWRGTIHGPTVNCYLYDIRENQALRTPEPLTIRSADGRLVTRVAPPVRVDCAYCITAWSTATTEPVLEEHNLLGQILLVLLKNPTIPSSMLQGALAGQIAPYPTVIASPDGVKNQPEFWTALDQKLKPSLNYIVTLAVLLDALPAAEPTPFSAVNIAAGQPEAALSANAPADANPHVPDPVFTITEK